MRFIFGILKRFIRFFLYIGIIVAIILLIPNLPPYTKFTSIDLEQTQPRTGPLAPNGDLNNVEKLYTNKLLGPETFQLWNDEVYTSLATGEIVKTAQGGHVTFVTQIGKPCTGIIQEHICGRPLGFVIDDKKRQMYVADAYYGIWKVDLQSYKKQLLVSPRVEIEGRKPMVFNSVTLANNGDLYWTDSTSEYHLKDGVMSIVSDPAGRLFRYNPTKNESTVLLDNIWFANGVLISPDNKFVLVVETNKMRLLKYYIDGPKKGTTEVFVAGLPGTPDNIRQLPDGSGVLIALYAAFDDDHPLLLKSLASTPLARKFAARFMRLLEIPFEFLNTHFPNIIFEEIVYYIGHFATISRLGPGISGLVQTDWSGNIVASHYNTDLSVSHISDAIVFNDKLFLGSPHMQNFIGSVPVPPLLKKAFSVPNKSSMSENDKKIKEPTKLKVTPEQKSPPPEKNVVAEKTIDKRKIEKHVEQKTTEKPAKTQVPQPQKPNRTPEKQAEVKINPIPNYSLQATENEVDQAQEFPKQGKTIPESKTLQKAEGRAKVPSATIKEAVIEKDPKKQIKVEKFVETPSSTLKPPESKSATTQKPSESKPTIAQKPSETKPSTTEKPSETISTTTQKQSETKSTTAQKPSETKSSTGQKPSETKSTTTKIPAPKVETPKIPVTKPKKANSGKKAKKPSLEDEPQIIVQKVVPDEIPVEEVIPSDTAKPNRDTLKVIKKSGPIEIPTPSV